jgi:hypothetical protein
MLRPYPAGPDALALGGRTGSSDRCSTSTP